MTISLRDVFRQTLPPYLQAFPINIGAAVKYADIGRNPPFDGPLSSIRELVAILQALPESITLHQEIETGAALRGDATMEVHRDGRVRFTGHMNATGFPSFSYRIGAVLRSGKGSLALSMSASGSVFGSDTPGKHKESHWDQGETTDRQRQAIINLWPDVAKSTMIITRNTELSGVLGTTLDVLKDVAKILLIAETGGATFAICIAIGVAAGEAGVDVPGMGGILGIGIIAGSVFIWGPLAIGPAFVAGVAVGAIVDALIKIRRLTTEEIDFARTVFGDSINYDCVRISNLNGFNDRPFTIPTFDGHALINIGAGPAFDNPITAVRDNSSDLPGQLFIHEMTHAWQIMNQVIFDSFVPGYLCNGIGEQVSLGQAAYNYGPAGAAWNTYGLEGQAALVDNWFAGNGGQKIPSQGGKGTGIPMDEDSKYFPYILGIRQSIPQGGCG